MHEFGSCCHFQVTRNQARVFQSQERHVALEHGLPPMGCVRQCFDVQIFKVVEQTLFWNSIHLQVPKSPTGECPVESGRKWFNSPRKQSNIDLYPKNTFFSLFLSIKTRDDGPNTIPQKSKTREDKTLAYTQQTSLKVQQPKGLSKCHD